MKPSFIYIVGQPDPSSNVLEIIRRLGYKAGILIDSQLTLKNPEEYDRVVSVEYGDLDAEIQRLDTLDLSIAGLLCTYENYIVAKAKLGEHFNVPAPSLQSAKLATDKSLMRRAFLDADRSISPDFTTADSLDKVLAFAHEHAYPLVLKPTNLVKSLLVLRCNDQSELIENFTYAQDTIQALYEKYHIYDRAPQLIVEEFIIGKQCSIAAFVDAEGTPHFCDGIVALTNAQDINVSDNYLYRRALPVEFDETLSKEMFDVAEKGIRALEMRSVPAHVELMYGESGVKIIEIGARIGGYRPRMYNYSYGLDLTEQEIRLALGQTPELEGTFQNYCAVYELFPATEGTFSEISGEEDTEAFAYYRVTAKPGKIVGPAKNGHKATAIIIVVEDDKEKFDQLCESVDRLKVQVT
ncbi:MAG: ATP-grasp domain-containing protein [Candidatus Saccharimonadales bacterium]